MKLKIISSKSNFQDESDYVSPKSLLEQPLV